MFDNPGDWAQDHGVRIVIILLLAIVLRIVVGRVVPRSVRLSMRRHAESARSSLPVDDRIQRAETVSQVFVRTIDVLIVVVAAILVLAEVGVSLAPLIAGAGVVGIAVGFGAQSLIRDTLTGLFILLEDQYRVGDIIEIAGVGGTVEELGMRRTVLRDLDGVLHTVPNGEITVASNMSRGWSRVNLNISIGYATDLAGLRTLVDEVGRQMAADAAWEPLLLEPPAVLRVDAFEESAIAVKVVAKTPPGKQWEVAGELRQRLKAAFDDAGIEIPYPHRVVIAAPPGSSPADATSAAA